MSRLRKIFKGEENWDVMYTDQDMILGTVGKTVVGENNFNASASSPNTGKIFKEDNKEANNLNNNSTSYPRLTLNFNSNNAPVNRISNKLSNVSINNNNVNKNLSKIDNDNREETDVQDLFFHNGDHTENLTEVNEKDYENFDHLYEDEMMEVKENITIKNYKSETQSVNSEIFKYKCEKRNFTKAFGESASVYGESLHEQRSLKKMKYE